MGKIATMFYRIKYYTLFYLKYGHQLTIFNEYLKDFLKKIQAQFLLICFRLGNAKTKLKNIKEYTKI